MQMLHSGMSPDHSLFQTRYPSDLFYMTNNSPPVFKRSSWTS